MPLGSWYSQLPAFGWFDPEDRPGSAAYQVGGRSIPDSQQGIALPTRGGLGKWYNVTPPGADRPFPLQQTDLGPAKWTGRGVDISAAGAHQMGYTPKNFPTDAEFKVEPIDLTGLGLAAGYGGGVPGDNQTAVASGPPQGRKMPASLMDMLTGNAPLEFNPRNAAGEPSSFADALSGRSNSLVGLGLGLLQPRSMAVGAPVGNAWTGALEGYQAGANADARQAMAQAQLKHQKTQDARQAAMDRFNMAMQEKQFARSGEGDFSKVAREIGLAPGTPEYTAAANKYYQGKTEGDWSVAEVQHPLYPDQKVPMWVNKRTRETAPITGTGGAPGTTSVAGAPDVFTSGTAPVYGQGAGGYSAPSTPATGTAAIPSPAAPTGRAFPPPAPGVNLTEYTKEKTKEYVKQQAEAEQKTKRAGRIDPVAEDIDRAINAVQANPNLTTGLGGQLLRNLPGTKAGDVEALVNTIKNNSSLDKLQELKAQSQTGASGLGAISDKEQKILQGALGDLEQSRGTATFLYNLDRVRRIRHEIIHGEGTAPPSQFQPPPEQRASSARQTAGGAAAPRPGFVKGGYVFKGGDPSDQSNWAPVR